MFIPKPLSVGARVALIAPSGPVPESRLCATVKSVETFGFQPVVYDSCKKQHGYFAGSDRQRAQDVNEAFAASDVDGVICVRGGYGAHRLMDLIDFDAIEQTPKFFCGYSDITALHLAFNQRCGFVTYHTPMPATEWYEGLDPYTENSLRRALFGTLKKEVENPADTPLCTLAKGVCQGQLVGGNLSLVTATLGTPYEINTKDKVLFLEDIGEEPYRVDRMLLMLKAAGKLRACAGIVLGAFTEAAPQNPDRSLRLEEVFEELLLDEGKPIVSGLQCGHIMPTLSLPLGLNVRLDATMGTLTFLEGVEA